MKKTPAIDVKENTKYDARHGAMSTIHQPKDPDGLNVVRCMGCRTLNTEWEMRLLGVCRSCGGMKFCGGSPNWSEWCRIQFLHFTRNWRSKGWKNAAERDGIRRSVTHAK